MHYVRRTVRWPSTRYLYIALFALFALSVLVLRIGNRSFKSSRPVFTCSSKQIEDQRASFVELTAPGWYSACEGHNTLKALHEASPGRCGKVFIDVGANKGVSLV